MNSDPVVMMQTQPLKRLRKRDLVRLLEQEQRALRLDRQARQLALPLMQQLGLFPNGIDLVCWLDVPAAHSNLAALTVWVRSQMDCPDFEHQSQSTSVLVLMLDRLQARLALIEASFAP
jgi:hypothetical protein